MCTAPTTIGAPAAIRWPTCTRRLVTMLSTAHAARCAPDPAWPFEPGLGRRVKSPGVDDRRTAHHKLRQHRDRRSPSRASPRPRRMPGGSQGGARRPKPAPHAPRSVLRPTPRRSPRCFRDVAISARAFDRCIGVAKPRARLRDIGAARARARAASALASACP